MRNLTLIIPAKNESESLPLVLRDLKNIECNITVSLSREDMITKNSIKNFNVKVHEQSRLGYGSSLIEAINECQTEFFCIFNADGSFDEKDLKKMLELIKNYDFIFASRYLKGGGSDDDTVVTYIGNQIFSFLGKVMFSLNLDDILYTFVMGKTKSFNNLNLKSNDFRFCVEFPIKLKQMNMKYSSIPSHEKKRIKGQKKVSAVKDGFLILIEILKLFVQYKILKQNKN